MYEKTIEVSELKIFGIKLGLSLFIDNARDNVESERETLQKRTRNIAIKIEIKPLQPFFHAK